jgi:hypothetical protein
VGRTRFAEDDATRWLNEHPEELERYCGQQIAVHGVQGIVAAADDIDELRKLVEDLGLRGQVLYSAVPGPTVVG